MVNYVLGFAFSSDRNYVALILKNGKSVPEHRGKLNGIGGKIEAHETCFEAMRREFREETGVDVPEKHWEYRGKFGGPGWNVKVFRFLGDEVFDVQTVTDEAVKLVDRRMFWRLERCPHVDLLVDLCLNKKIKSFEFTEAPL